jgi:ankyrin repeat protein
MPYDVQVLYNLSFNGRLLWYLEAIYEETLKRGRAADWADPEWRMLGMGPYGSGARYVLGVAMEYNDVELARWALDHGATPSPSLAEIDERGDGERTMLDEALRRGFADMADLLERYGATRSVKAMKPAQLFVDACLHLDEPRARELLARHPELVSTPDALHAAAALDRGDALALILDLGVSPNVPNPQSGNQLALHAAAWMDAPTAIRVLIDRGGDVDRVDETYGATPLGFAIYGNKTRAIDVLKRYGDDVGNLAIVGGIDRLRVALAANPSLAMTVWPDEQITPLMRLPGDPGIALEVAKLLVAYGADPHYRNSAGLTAIDLAERRGLGAVVAFLRRGSE